MTLTRVWQYDVRPGAEAAFLAAYGAEGSWARLFSASDGYVGTELFRSLETPGRYLTVDRFLDHPAWRRFLADQGGAYRRLDERCADLTLAERELAEVDDGQDLRR